MVATVSAFGRSVGVDFAYTIAAKMIRAIMLSIKIVIRMEWSRGAPHSVFESSFGDSVLSSSGIPWTAS